MKKKFLILILILVVTLSVVLLVGCNSGEVIDTNYSEKTYSIDAIRFSEDNLVFDVNTGIVYIENCIYANTYSRVYTPYLSSNGLPYRCVNNKLVEIEINQDGE